MTLWSFRQRKQFRLLAAILASAIPLGTSAQSVWTGSVNNNWSLSNNWDNNNVPGDSVNEDATLNSGTPIVNGDFTLRNFDFLGGTLHGTVGNELEIGQLLTWSGGSVASDAFVNVTGSALLSGTLQNSGVLTINLTGGSIGVDLATVLNNSGTLSVSGTTLNFRSGTNTGRLTAGAGGTVLFQGVGSYNLAAGTSLSGSGTFSFGTAVNLQEAVSVENLVLTGSILGGTLSTTGNVTWSGGEMKGGGKTTISTGTMVLMTSGVKSLESRELVNNSTIQWGGTGDWLVHSGASLVNNNRFMITGDATMSAAPLTTVGTLVNAGIVEKTAGAGSSSILIPVSNSGTVSVFSGTLRLARGTGAGTWMVGTGATLIFAGGSALPGVLDDTATIGNSGTLINAGYLSVPAGALVNNDLIMDATSGAELNVRGDLAVEEFVWNRGVLSGPGTSAMAGHTFDDFWGVAGGRLLENTGSLIWAAGAEWGLGVVDAASAFDNVNPGTLQNNAGAKIIFNDDAEMGLPAKPELLKVENSGEIKVSDDLSASIHGAVNNIGTITLGDDSALNLAAGGTSSGTFAVGNDSQLIFSGSAAHTLNSSARLDGIGSATSSHDILFDAATTNFAGQAGSLTSLHMGIDEDSAAMLNLLSGSVLQPKSMTLTGGSINAQSGSTLNTPRLELNGGRMTVHGGSTIQIGSTTLGTDSGPASTLKLNSGAMFQSTTFELKTSGLLWLEGGTLKSSNPVQVGGFGSVVGMGTIDASVNSTSGVLTPGVEPGEIGQVTVTGDLSLDASTFVGIDIDTQTVTADRINTAGSMDLGGALLFVTVVGNPADLSSGNQFVILTSSARTGTLNFDSIHADRVLAYNLASEVVGEFQVEHSSTQVLLTNWVPEPPYQVAALGIGFLLRRRRSQLLAA